MDSHYLNNTIRLAHTISALVDQGTVAKYGEAIYKQYLDASDEERENQEGEAYRSRFEGIGNNADYQAVRSTLTRIKEENDVKYAYIMLIDKKKQVCIYVADGETNEETNSAPGIWEPIEKEQADSLWAGNEAESHTRRSLAGSAPAGRPSTCGTTASLPRRSSTFPWTR